MDKTLDELPGQGKISIEVKKTQREGCEICGADAHYKHTWLLDGARSNPNSSAYHKDDCSWCEDAATFACRDCTDKIHAPEGYKMCSVFPASAQFSHMFLTKRSVKIGTEMADAFDKIVSKL
jgi:hypothetical protein